MKVVWFSASWLLAPHWRFGYGYSVCFEWDEEKNKTNIQKHGIDFADAVEVFRSPMLTAIDDRHAYGEDRWIGIGTFRWRVIVLLFTERDDTIRIISMRKALKHERQRYEQILKDELGAD